MNEAAGEIERLWELEKAHTVLKNDFGNARWHWSGEMAEKDAEIADLKNRKDDVALVRENRRGYRRAAMVFTNIIGNLLMEDEDAFHDEDDHTHE